MNKTSNFSNNNDQDLLPEYDFDYQKAKPNRFAVNQSSISTTITLDADVARVFKTSQDVNNALRAIISAIPLNKSSEFGEVRTAPLRSGSSEL